MHHIQPMTNRRNRNFKIYNKNCKCKYCKRVKLKMARYDLLIEQLKILKEGREFFNKMLGVVEYKKKD